MSIELCNARRVSGSAVQKQCAVWAHVDFPFCLFLCQHENGERRDPEPKPSSNQTRKFVRFMSTIFVYRGEGQTNFVKS